MAKVVPIIEWQDRQRTPKEAVQYISDKIDAGKISHMIVLARDDTSVEYIPCSIKRNYKKSLILWDLEQFKHWFITECDDLIDEE